MDARITKEKDIIEKIKSLIKRQNFFVLCTSDSSGPYGSLIAYSYSDSFEYLYFATSKNTKKYQMLKQNPRVSAVIDSRDSGEVFKRLEAMTISGTAEQMPGGSCLEKSAMSLKRRHPYLSDFLGQDDTVVFCLKGIKIYYVLDLNTVYEWEP